MVDPDASDAHLTVPTRASRDKTGWHVMKTRHRTTWTSSTCAGEVGLVELLEFCSSRPISSCLRRA